MKIKVIHLVSSMQLGGVEKGINLSIEALNKDFDYSVATLSNHNTFFDKNLRHNFLFAKNKYVLFSIIPTLLKIKQQQPSIVVVSLWKSYIIGVLLKIFRFPNLKIIAFIHNENYFHWLDKCFTNLILKKTDAIAYDSASTMNAFKHLVKEEKKQFVIPYIFNQINDSFNSSLEQKIPIRFLYAGRIHKSKNIENIILFFSEFKKIEPNFVFDIYGSGSLQYIETLNEYIRQLGLQQHINFKGIFNSTETSKVYSNYHFYIQFSKLEGMAMSIVDAMIHGIIPIATPVGEIKNYITHLQNGILIEHNLNDENYKVLAQTIMDLYNNFQEFSRLKNNASNYFSNQKNYIQSFKEMIDTLNR